MAVVGIASAILLTPKTAQAGVLPEGSVCGTRSNYQWEIQNDGETPSEFSVDGVTFTPSVSGPIDPTSGYIIQDDGLRLGNHQGLVRLSLDGTDGNQIEWALSSDQPVHDLQMTILDLDRFDWLDIVELHAYNGSTEISHTMNVDQRFSSVLVADDPPLYVGASTAANNSQAGNLIVNIPGPVTRFEIRYIDGVGPSGQHIGISDPSWCSAQVGVSNRVLNGPIDNGNGTFDLTYRVTLENLGGHPLGDLEVLDDLTAYGTFSPSGGPNTYTVAATVVQNSAEPLTLNPAFDGQTVTSIINGVSGGSINLDERVEVDVMVTFVPDLGSVPYSVQNSVSIRADRAWETDGVSDGITTDISDDGVQSDANHNGNPSDAGEEDPTLVLIQAVPTPVLSEDPRISVDKQFVDFVDLDGSGAPSIGDFANFEIIIANTGDVQLTAVAALDSLAIVDCGGVTVIEPGQNITCQAPVELVHFNLNRKYILNRVDVSALSPAGSVITDADVVFTRVVPDFGVDVEKSFVGFSDTNASGRVDAGDQANFEIRVANNGATDLANLTISDLPVGPAACGSTPVVVPAGSNVLCTVSLPVTLDHLNAGVIRNLAIAFDDTNFVVRFGAGSAQAVVPQSSSMTLEKSIVGVSDLDGSESTNAGDRVSYQLTIRNTGTVTLDSLLVEDSLTGTLTCDASTLLPNESSICTTSHTVTPSEALNGFVDNQATASALGPLNERVSAADNAHLEVEQPYDLSLTASSTAVDGVLTLTVLIENLGPGSTDGPVQTIINIPSLMQLTSISTSTGTCEINTPIQCLFPETMAPDDPTWVITLIGTLPPEITHETLIVSGASVWAGGTDINETNDDQEVVTQLAAPSADTPSVATSLPTPPTRGHIPATGLRSSTINSVIISLLLTLCGFVLVRVAKSR